MAKRKAFIRDGRKYYPCAGFEANQHKLEYWSNFYKTRYDDTGDEKDYEMGEKWEELFCMSMSCTMNDGIMYFPYPEFTMVKEGIARYDMKH